MQNPIRETMPLLHRPAKRPVLSPLIGAERKAFAKRRETGKE
jgi:hypothetical protein